MTYLYLIWADILCAKRANQNNHLWSFENHNTWAQQIGTKVRDEAGPLHHEAELSTPVSSC